jgi:autotransporter-associated beta strand protein
MHVTSHSNRTARVTLAVASVLCLASTANAGFIQSSGGPWDYNSSANWASGIIDGLFNQVLTGTGQTVTFAADTTITTGLTFQQTGNFDLTLRSDGGANRTLTLGGDISHSIGRTTTIGSSIANQNLNLVLGGSRTFSVTNAAGVLNTLNTITSNANENLTKTGPGRLVINNNSGQLGGDLIVNEGTVDLRDRAVSITAGNVRTILLGDTSGSANATLRTNASSSVLDPILVRSGSTGEARIGLGSANNRGFSGPITLQKDLYLTDGGVTNGNTLNVSSIISGTGNLNVRAAGVVDVLIGSATLSASSNFNANSFVGDTNIIDVDAVTLNKISSFSTGDITITAANSLILGNSFVLGTSATASDNSLTVLAGSGLTSINLGATSTVVNTLDTFNFQGTMVPGGSYNAATLATALGITVTGSGTLNILAVPEPTTLLLASAAGMLVMRRRR